MKVLTQYTLLSLCVLLIALGCSGGGTPTSPRSEPGITSGQGIANNSQTHLWGYYDVFIDIPSQTATAVLNRNVMFAANIVQFINGNPANLQFHINGTSVAAGNLDVDIDVTIKHPFPGLSQYNGYDVRGIFVANGSQTLAYNGSLKYAAYGASDQVMYDYNALASDPHSGLVGMPDGYSRWFNPSEFTTPGLFGYKQGLYASPGYQASATLNPYKYFADGLDLMDDAVTFLKSTSGNGVFSAGASNTRNYYLRFPTPAPGVKYGYAIVANWKGEKPEFHPANAPEAVALKADVTPDVYYVSPADKGGKLKLDLTIVDWDSHPVAGLMSDYKIILESTVLNTPYTASTAEMHPTGSGSNYATFHVEATADHITGTTGNEFWVIAEDQSNDYTNTFGVPNSAGTDKLAAFFRSDLYVSPTAYNKPPVCDLDAVGPFTGTNEVNCVFDATGSSDPDAGDTLTYAWDFNGNGVYGESPADSYTGSANNPTHKYTGDYVGNVNLKVTDPHGAFDECLVQVNIDVKINNPPVCDLHADGPFSGIDEVDCVFDATGSHDPDAGDVLTYTWDFNGNGVYGESPADSFTGPTNNPTHKYTSDYVGNVNVKVTDSSGAFDVCTVPVNIDVKPNSTPVCDLYAVGPFDGWGQVDCTFDATGSYDPDAGDSITYEWDFNGNGIYGESPDDDYSGSADYPTHAFTSDYYGNVNVKVTDTHGAYAVCKVPVGIYVKSTTIYLYDGKVDDGGMTEFSSSGQDWKFMGEGVWDENGDYDYLSEASCSTLITPPMDIPSDVSAVHLLVEHSGSSTDWYGGTYCTGGGLIGYTMDGGGYINYNRTTCPGSSEWLKLWSGLDFNCPDYYFMPFYEGYNNWDCLFCDEWAIAWYNVVFGGTKWGDIGSPEQSDWTCNELIGATKVQFVFTYTSSFFVFGPENGRGWELAKVWVYVEP